jgi:integrase
MALMIDLDKQGIHRVTAKGKEYHYAWRGGPPLKSTPGTLAYVQEFLAHKKAKDEANEPTKNFGWVISKFKATTEFTSLKERTKKDYLDKIEKIEKKFASLPLSAFNATNEKRTRGWFKGWRDDLAKKSLKQADYHWVVLARICSVAAERGWINVNPCIKGGRVYASNRQELIWLSEDEEKFYAGAPHHMSLAVLLAVWTGQRQGDLLRMCWSKGEGGEPYVDGDYMYLKQGKTSAYIKVPIIGPLKIALDAERKRATSHCILTGARGEKWESGFASEFSNIKNKLGFTHLTFHDLRGTAVTRLAMAGCTDIEIASVTGHSLATVKAILEAHYLGGKSALAEQAMRKLEQRWGKAA